LLRASDAYHIRVMQRLSWLTMLLQPTVMILLGMLVALLIFAVYGPIFNMSRIF
jgi:type II secretory pathway component PulF